MSPDIIIGIDDESFEEEMDEKLSRMDNPNGKRAPPTREASMSDIRRELERQQQQQKEREQQIKEKLAAADTPEGLAKEVLDGIINKVVGIVRGNMELIVF
jgi:hypothetical protein